MADDRDARIAQLEAELRQSRAENVALREKEERRDRALAEAHEVQSATAEVLRVISRSAFQLQSVLDTLVENAVRLCRADFGVIRRYDGEVSRWAADFGATAEWRTIVQ